MISRRDFIKGAAASAVGVATAGVLSACTNNTTTSVETSTMTWDKEADVIIVGGGGTGLAAAVQASADGASVMVLEKAGIAGGTTSYSGGVVQAAGTKVQKQFTSFQNDTPEKHAELWIKAGEGTVDEELVKDLAKGAPEHIQWMESLGLKFSHVYGHCTIPYVEKELFADRIHVYEGGGGHAGGVVMVQAMLKAAEANGTVVEYETEVTSLIMSEEGEIIGVTAKQGDAVINVKANKGVILAAASIDQNVEMAKELSPQQYWDLTTQLCLCAKTNTGDGIRMAMEIGAGVGGFGGTIDFCGKTGAATDNRNPMFPSFIVNKNGRRFVNEEATYAYHYRAIFQQEKQLNGPTYMIFGESSLADKYAKWTKESLEKDIADGIVIKADTIEALAEQIGVHAGNLAKALVTWNEEAVGGTDEQFGRVEGLTPIEGPFYAYKNTSYNLGALGGVRINKSAQVLKPNGEAIPRLYAGGLNAAGWLGPYYPGSGTAIMGTIHWGRKAGAHAASLNAVEA